MLSFWDIIYVYRYFMWPRRRHYLASLFAPPRRGPLASARALDDEILLMGRSSAFDMRFRRQVQAARSLRAPLHALIAMTRLTKAATTPGRPHSCRQMESA